VGIFRRHERDDVVTHPDGDDVVTSDEPVARDRVVTDRRGDWGGPPFVRAIFTLLGVAAETASVMVVYLDEAYERRVREGRMTTAQDLREAIMEGAVQRVRPKMMTVAAIMGGLLPIMWTTGTGADVMKRIAAPMIGGMVSSTILTLIVIPILYFIWKRWSMSPDSSTEKTFARPPSS